MDVTGAKIYFTIPIFGGINITQTTVSSLLVAIIICTAAYMLGKNLKKRPSAMQVLVEKGVQMLYDMVGSVMGEHNLEWAPFIGTIFLSSLLGSLIGMTGFLRSATADLSVTLTWALMVSVIIWYQSIKRNGVLGWLKGFTEPIAVMTPMNIISEIAQPVSLAFRHFGNVVGGSVITSILYMALAGASTILLNLITASGIVVALILTALGAIMLFFGIRGKNIALIVLGGITAALGLCGIVQAVFQISLPILSLGIPAVLSLYFDLFSGFIQAYVFCLLTMVYISNVCPPPAAEEAEA